MSIILPVVTRPEQFNTINNFAVQLNEKYQTIEALKLSLCQNNECHASQDTLIFNKKRYLLSFGGIHPDTLDYKRELRVIKDYGLLGIKLHPDYQNTYIDDLKYMRILDYASELGLISVIHAGVDIGFPDNVRCTPKRIRRVIDDVAPENMVLAHYGGFNLWEEVEELLVGENIYLDTAYTFGFIKDEVFLRILKNHGADKILFATDSPWGGQKEALSHLQKFVNTKDINLFDLEKITGQNAIKLMSSLI